LKGTKLEFVPAVHTTWAEWKAQHPDTMALVKGYKGTFSSYAGYYSSPRAGVIGETYKDNRLYVKEFVIGVEHDGQAMAYPFSALNDQPVVNDQISELPVLVVFNVNGGSAAVFNRQIESGQLLTFSVLEGTMIKDAETGSTWDGLSGLSIGGQLAGTQLEPIKSTASFWFGWKDWYPDTGVFGQ
jgi:hypothetical protein